MNKWISCLCDRLISNASINRVYFRYCVTNQSITKTANPFVQLDNAINSFLDSATISNIINSLQKVSDFKNKLESVEIPKLDGIKTKIEALFDIRNKLLGVGTFEFSDIPVLSQLVSLSNWINNSLNAGSIDAVIKSMKSIIDFKNKLDGVEIPDVSSVKDKLSKLKNIANELNVLLNNGESGNIFTVFGSLFNSWTTGNNAGSIKSALDAINSTIDTINKISKLKDIDKEGIQTKLNQIKEAIKSLDFKLPHISKVDEGNLKSLSSIKKVLSDFTSITDSLNAFNPVDLSDKVEQIKQALIKLSELATPDLYQPFTKDLGASTKDAGTFFTAFKTIADGLTSLAAVPDLTDVQTRLEQIKTAINSIKESGIAEALSSFGKKDVAKGGESAKSLIASIVDIANTLSTLTVQIDEATITTSVNSIKNVLNSLVNGDNNFVAISQKLGKSKADFSLAKQMIDSVTEVVNSINAMPIVNAETWQTNAPQIMGVLSGMKTMSVYLEEVATINQKVVEAKTTFTSLNDLINTINSLSVVNEGASGTISSLKDILNQLSTIDINTNFSTQIAQISTSFNSLVTSLQLLTGQFTQIGTNAGNNVYNGFKSSSFSQINVYFQQIKDQMNQKADFTSIGTKMSDTLKSGFKIDSIISEINRIQTAINGLTGKTIDINVNRNETTYKKTVKRRNGGMIPEYHSSGGKVGSIFKPSGTDTVPAMLTPGEFVIKRSVVSSLGKHFFDSINNLNLSSALRSLQSKTNQVVYNTTNNITQNVDNNASYLNGLNRIGRILR